MQSLECNTGEQPTKKGDALRHRPFKLFSKSKSFNKTLVGFFTLALNIVQKASAASHQRQEAATTRVILLVYLQMFGQTHNPMTQDRDLNSG